MQKWGLNDDGQTTCEYGDEHTLKHLLVFPILPQRCSHEVLEESNPNYTLRPALGGSHVVTREED